LRDVVAAFDPPPPADGIIYYRPTISPKCFIQVSVAGEGFQEAYGRFFSETVPFSLTYDTIRMLWNSKTKRER
jgi:hypothetical protein